LLVGVSEECFTLVHVSAKPAQLDEAGLMSHRAALRSMPFFIQSHTCIMLGCFIYMQVPIHAKESTNY